ncbi:hypothetical protein [Streptomyces yerevanensis]|uniref:hypothetical protein n=1 Tax=Streptomyces yerevanensis TaxID=66378 RepID=UPI000524DB6C|nr:hypothetical protein [Streptomyces yerevanensis]
MLPQPFNLAFERRQGRSQHIPDFTAVLPDGSPTGCVQGVQNGRIAVNWPCRAGYWCFLTT